MKITFTQEHRVKQGDGKGPHYERGKTYEFSGAVAETYARKYIARGYAVEVAKESPKLVKDAPLLDVPTSAMAPVSSGAVGQPQPAGSPRRSAAR